jgi:[CysO sulfur-carrier protein]-S-L-cysteine hydrolase
VKPLRERGVEDEPPSGLRLDRATYDAILAHLRAWLPVEGCGLLATSFAQKGTAERVERYFPGTNIHRSPTSYEMDPAEVIAALQEIEANDWRLGAIVHSHPATAAEPSATDLRQAFYPGALMVIVSFKSITPNLRAWRVESNDGQARVLGEAPVVIGESRST